MFQNFGGVRKFHYPCYIEEPPLFYSIMVMKFLDKALKQEKIKEIKVQHILTKKSKWFKILKKY